MADNELIKQNYKDIANAIRAKTGENGTMTANEMPQKIAAIETGITPRGITYIHDNGRYDVTTYATAEVSIYPLANAWSGFDIYAQGGMSVTISPGAPVHYRFMLLNIDVGSISTRLPSISYNTSNAGTPECTLTLSEPLQIALMADNLTLEMMSPDDPNFSWGTPAADGYTLGYIYHESEEEQNQCLQAWNYDNPEDKKEFFNEVPDDYKYSYFQPIAESELSSWFNGMVGPEGSTIHLVINFIDMYGNPIYTNNGDESWEADISVSDIYAYTGYNGGGC